MSLLLDERSMYSTAELLLRDGPLKVSCRLTVEWLRGISEPTWYGYFVPFDQEISVLPGRYRLHVGPDRVEILVRRSTRLGEEVCFPFWGFGRAPAVPEASADLDQLPPALD